MKKNCRYLFGLLGFSLALAGHPAWALTVGQKLSAEEIAQWGELPAYDIGGSQIRVLPSQQPGSEATLLLNAQGVVGSSRNEVSISDAPAERVRELVQRTLPRPLSVQHYEPTGITVLRYADFGQAVEGLNALKAALPGAKVRLPVQFGKRVPY